MERGCNWKGGVGGGALGEKTFLTVSGQLNGGGEGGFGGPFLGGGAFGEKTSPSRGSSSVGERGGSFERTFHPPPRNEDRSPPPPPFPPHKKTTAGEMYACALGDIYTFGPTFRRARGPAGGEHLTPAWAARWAAARWAAVRWWRREASRNPRHTATPTPGETRPRDNPAHLQTPTPRPALRALARLLPFPRHRPAARRAPPG